MFLSWKRVIANSGSGLLPQVEEFKDLRVLFSVKLEWSGRVTD